MHELSLHILDITQNSVSAGASNIVIEASGKENILTVTVTDDGCGMDAETLAKALTPFGTSRKTRKVGLGLPLLKLTAEQTGGSFSVESEKGRGTVVRAVYDTASVDCLPLGDMGATMLLLVSQDPKIHYIYRRSQNGKGFCLDTDEVKAELSGLPLDTPEVLEFISGYINENEKELWRCDNK